MEYYNIRILSGKKLKILNSEKLRKWNAIFSKFLANF